MTRRHADPVEVRTHADAPAQFLWRSRLYVVREVLACWTESGSWWQTPALTALHSGEAGTAAPGPLELVALPPSPKWAQRAWGEPAPDVDTSTGPAGIDDGERTWWRVEAAAGRSAGSGVYDLCVDIAGGNWSLARVLD